VRQAVTSRCASVTRVVIYAAGRGHFLRLAVPEAPALPWPFLWPIHAGLLGLEPRRGGACQAGQRLPDPVLFCILSGLLRLALPRGGNGSRRDGP
jgi:hypothetical protein